MIKTIKGVVKMVYFNLLKRIILAENYTTKKEVQMKIDGFFEKGKITQTQKEELERLLNQAN